MHIYKGAITDTGVIAYNYIHCVASAPEVVRVHREWPAEECARLLVFVPGESTLL